MIKELMSVDASTRYKDKKADCDGRINDNRSTHFQFGSDGEPGKHSEQVVLVLYVESLTSAAC